MQILADIAISIAVSHLKDFGTATNWAQVKQAVDNAVNSAVHYTFLDDAIESVSDEVIDGVALVCQKPDAVKGVLDAAAGGDYVAAVTGLKALVAAVMPKTPAGLAIAKLLA